MRYQEKPLVIEAIQWNGDNKNEVDSFSKVSFPVCRANTLGIQTLEGMMYASIGDYIIKGVKGEFYPCKPDVFKMTYDEVEAK